MSMYVVIRDTREKSGHGWLFQPNGLCVGTDVRKLHVGDYSIEGLEDIIAIERKESVTELAHNIIEPRWYDVIDRLSKVRHAYFICEFTWTDVVNYPASAKLPAKFKRKLRVPSGLIRKRVYEAREKGIHFCFCDGKHKAQELAYRLLRRAYILYVQR